MTIRDFKTLPNLFTTIRLVGIPLFCWLWFYLPLWLSAALLGFLFLTDFLDGWFARLYGQETHFGSIFDPITDRVATLVIYVWMAAAGLDYKWLAAIVVLRHFSQLLSLPVLMGLLKRNFFVKAKAFPKWVTFYNSVYVFYPLYLKGLFDLQAASQTQGSTQGGWASAIGYVLAVPMAFCELKLLIDFWPRFIAIAFGRHDTFE